MNPVLLFLLLFVGIPLTELYFLIKVGSQIGAFPTIFLTIFTALVGGLMVRIQGFSTLMRVREMTQRNEMPAIEVMEGAVLLVCGLLLLLPGFITDVVGFVFLVPPIRRWLLTAGLQGSGILRPLDPEQPGSHHRQDVIEGEFRREEDESSPHK
ncbi:MAG: FxsA family protein [Candidatus Thiodiazotropha sp. (ex Monitilora ramsayi)]|nr:FxsA family protein [Candidatus Thiodiazotropha sp. (ex Monitilora ramsayi)]